VWSFGASDIYQGGEKEPRKLTETCCGSIKPLDTEREKNYLQVAALNVRALSEKQIRP